MKLAVVIAAVVGALALGRFAQRRERWRKGMLFLLALLPFTELVFLASANFLSHDEYRGHSRGFEITIVDLLALALFVALPRGRHPIPYRPWFLAYLAVAGVSVLYAWDMLYAAFGFWKVLRGFFLAVVVAKACEDEKAPPVILKGLAWGLIVQLGYALRERYLLGGHQVSGSFEHQNTLGMAVNLVVPIFFALLLASGTRKRLAAVALVAGMGCAVLTLSRGAMVMLPTALGIVYLGSIVRNFSWRKLQVGVAGLVVFAGVMLKSIDTIISRFVHAPPASVLGRQMFEKASANILGDHFFGVGINNYSHVMEAGGYGEAVGLLEMDQDGLVHHVYWLTAAETGYPGLIAWLLLMGAPLLLAFRWIRRERYDIRGEVLLGCFAGLAVTAVHSVLEWVLYQPAMMYLFWIQAVLVLGIVRKPEEERRNPASPWPHARSSKP